MYSLHHHRRLCTVETISSVENNLYSMALKTSILQMEKEYGHMDDSVLGENMRTDYRI